MAELLGGVEPASPVPTVEEYLPQVIAAAGPGAVRTYSTYCQRMAAAWADRPLDTIAATDVEALQRDCARQACECRGTRLAVRRQGIVSVAEWRAEHEPQPSFVDISGYAAVALKP
jgi:hypothetical protein